MFWIGQVVTTAAVLAASLFMLVADGAVSPQADDGDVLAVSTFVYPAQEGMPDINLIADYVAATRTEAGLPSLMYDENLHRVAVQRAADMRQDVYYAHHNPVSGRSFADDLRSSGYEYRYACENLNLQFRTDEAAFVSTWLASADGHRECLLHPDVQRVGFAVTTVPLTDDPSMASYVVVAIHAAP